MSRLTSVNFNHLSVIGINYLPWTLDVEILLQYEGLEKCILKENNGSTTDKVRALIKLCHHLHEDLKQEYQSIKDPYELWNSLAKRYGHKKDTLLPQARYEWLNLRIQDFKSVTEYNYDVHRITSTIKMCGETITDKDMLEKTLSAFSASDILLQQQYRNRGFTEHSDLITCLLVAEKNNELLLRNRNRWPVGRKTFPEVNHTGFGGRTHDNGSHRGRGYNGYCGRGRGRNAKRGCGSGGRGYGRSGNGYHENKIYNNQQFHVNSTHQNLKVLKPQSDQGGRNQKNYMNGACNKCGKLGHYAKDFKASIEEINEYKKTNTHPEAHFTSRNHPYQKFATSNFMEDDIGQGFESHHIPLE